jgi:hypothetical protein
LAARGVRPVKGRQLWRCVANAASRLPPMGVFNRQRLGDDGSDLTDNWGRVPVRPKTPAEQAAPVQTSWQLILTDRLKCQNTSYQIQKDAPPCRRFVRLGHQLTTSGRYTRN